VDDPLRRLADGFEDPLEVRERRLVGSYVLGGDDGVERDVEVAQGVDDDVAVGVGEDDQPQPAGPRLPQGGERVGEGLPGAHRSRERFAPFRAPGVAALVHPPPQALRQNLLVGQVRTLDELELDRLPAGPHRLAVVARRVARLQ
jgi:hypothetical protein